MFKRILIPLDGSQLAEAALLPAMALAQVSGGEILLLNVPFVREVYPTSTAGYRALVPDRVDEEPRDVIQDYLMNLQIRWSATGIKIHTMITDGDEASTILETASAENVDLIVMTTHGRTGLTRWVLGSVTERVLHDAPCPVLVMRTSTPLQKVLITLDGSVIAEYALEPGLAVARALDAQVRLLAVADSGHFDLVASAEIEEAVTKGTSAPLSDERAALEQYLGQLCTNRDWDGVKVAYEVVDGKAVAAILEYAEAHASDLIVMATHGRTGLRRWLYGSVSGKVMRSANRAMLIVRPPSNALR
ncbi:MAG: universal stress protein [Anaerolineae bacterium]|nr:universal stress protein [Anaerolineae bacterium]